MDQAQAADLRGVDLKEGLRGQGREGKAALGSILPQAAALSSGHKQQGDLPGSEELFAPVSSLPPAALFGFLSQSQGGGGEELTLVFGGLCELGIRRLSEDIEVDFP